MSFIPKTTCTRCHRQYSSTRQSCPYCGEKKPRELNRTIPEADSAVRGTQASVRSSENLNWQMLFGTLLVVAVLAAVIVMVSTGINKDISGSSDSIGQKREDKAGETVSTDGDVPDAAATAIPTQTPEPTPIPTDAPLVNSVAITYNTYDEPEFTASLGETVQLDCAFYPINNELTVSWSSSNESVATVDQTGLVTIVGSGQCEIYAEVGGVRDTCLVYARG